MQNGHKHVIVFYSATMPDVASLYSSSELELCWLNPLVFQYLLKYATFTVLMDHSALKHIYCSKKLAKTVSIQKFVKEILDFSFDFEHISGKHMFVSDFLSRFSSENKDVEPIPYITDTSLLANVSYMLYLDNMCDFNYDTLQGICTNHAFPVTRSQAKLQKIAIPPLFKSGFIASIPTQKPCLLRDPPFVLAHKRSPSNHLRLSNINLPSAFQLNWEIAFLNCTT